MCGGYLCFCCYHVQYELIKTSCWGGGGAMVGDEYKMLRQSTGHFNCHIRRKKHFIQQLCFVLPICLINFGWALIKYLSLGFNMIYWNMFKNTLHSKKQNGWLWITCQCNMSFFIDIALTSWNNMTFIFVKSNFRFVNYNYFKRLLCHATDKITQKTSIYYTYLWNKIHWKKRTELNTK